MTTTKSILKEQSEMMLMMKSDIREMKLYMEAFMKALMTEGASFPVVIVKDETKECKSEEPQVEKLTRGRFKPNDVIKIAERPCKKNGFIRSDNLAKKMKMPTKFLYIAANILGLPCYLNKNYTSYLYFSRSIKFPDKSDTEFWKKVSDVERGKITLK